MELRPGKVIIGKERIAERVESLGREINLAYGGQSVMLVGVLDGCQVFLSDLRRCLDMPVEVTLVKVKTYGDGTRPQAEPAIRHEDLARVKGRHVLVVDDIYDSGETLASILESIRRAGSRTVRTCVFLEKRREHERLVKVDFVGFEVPDEFVVGYGLDYAGNFRDLPHVAALDGSDEGPALA